MKLYDGDSSASSLIEKYCGTSLPPNFISSTNKAFIHFQSNKYAARTGFELEYRVISGKLKHREEIIKIKKLFFEELKPTKISSDFFISLKQYSIIHEMCLHTPVRHFTIDSFAYIHGFFLILIRL